MCGLKELLISLLLALNFQIADCSINLSLNKPARQSTTFTDPFLWDAGRAVDDGIISRARMAGYSLYLSNSSDIRSGQLCYQHSGSELPPSDISLTCNLIGRYLTIYVQRTGSEPITYSSCPVGKFGNGNCNSTCSVNCLNDSLCDPNNGCPVGKFGNGNCNSTCSVNCLNDSLCDPNNGTCTGGCAAGWQGATCNAACALGYFGANCIRKCGNCANDAICNHVTGNCPGLRPRCKKGWTGSQCLTGNKPELPNMKLQNSSNLCHECSEFTFGADCSGRCGRCLNASRCNSINGSCPLGCADGWEGEFCEKGLLLNFVKIRRIDQNVEKHQSLGVEAAGIVIGVVAGVLVLVSFLVVVIVLRRKQLKTTLPSTMRRMKSSYVTFDEDNTSVLNRGLTYHKRQSRGDNLEIGYGREGNFRIADDHKRVSHYISDLYAVVDKPKSKTKDKLIIREPTNKTRTSYRITIEIPSFRHDMECNTADDSTNGADGTSNTADDDKIYNEPDEIKRKTMFDEDIYHELADVEPGENSSVNTDQNEPQQNDHTRVVLEPTQEDKSDYINANYIDVKCAKYWLPQGINMKISNYIVTVDEEQEYAFFAIRKLKLVNTEVKKTRRVVHFHFTMWPDHGTPDPLQSALFQRHVTKETSKQTGPMVVHCSAGLGRTGTFIGLDALLRRGWKTGFVDIFEYVKQMRHNRLNMVQTADQYFIIHRALLEGFRLEDTTISKDSFKKTWEEMQLSDQPTNRKRIRDEFQKLDFLRPDYDESMFTSAHFEENVPKNRTSLILPIDRYRPLLSAPVPGQNDYINAVMIPSDKILMIFLFTFLKLSKLLQIVFKVI
ncbi:hypothetical protein KUTeg_016097 [Tegillarca granosa]|uniref:protein-tyrosine-phosphatase n=1 Tax=Tegillarca granosa TaxID=220873 RepID=A0ABQ9ENP0_TEGGR|nr:hypothetical protein KUTeg_016097 [Tegillarca granosa]